MNRRILREHLSQAGMIPTLAASAYEALGIVSSVDAGQPFDLIITDVHMPEMDGFEFIEKLKADGMAQSSVVMMITSIDSAESSARYRMLGVAQFIVKPVSKRSLLRAVMGAVENPTYMVSVPFPKAITAFDEAPLKILIAEDNAVNQKLVVRLLQKRNHQVTVASNGREAVQHARGGAFDAILMDVQMPILDGFSATREIRRWEEDNDLPRIPIVALTAHALLGDRERCLEAGMDLYLTKPLKAQELFELLEAVTSASLNGH